MNLRELRHVLSLLIDGRLKLFDGLSLRIGKFRRNSAECGFVSLSGCRVGVHIELLGCLDIDDSGASPPIDASVEQRLCDHRARNLLL